MTFQFGQSVYLVSFSEPYTGPTLARPDQSRGSACGIETDVQQQEDSFWVLVKIGTHRDRLCFVYEHAHRGVGYHAHAHTHIHKDSRCLFPSVAVQVSCVLAARGCQKPLPKQQNWQKAFTVCGMSATSRGKTKKFLSVSKPSSRPPQPLAFCFSSMGPVSRSVTSRGPEKKSFSSC